MRFAHNPYQWNKLNLELFYGKKRRSLVDQIVKELDHGESFAIVAGRRMGKTTLLRRVDAELHKKPYIRSIYIDAQSAQNLEKVDDAFTWLTSHASDFSVGAKSFGEWVSRFVEHTRYLKVAFLIDEFDSFKSFPWCQLFFNNWRYWLANAPDVSKHVVAVFAGPRALESILIDAGSPLGNVLSWRYLQLLDEEDTSALVDEPTDHQLPPEVHERIYEKTGGHPFLIQFIMSYVCRNDPDQAFTSIAAAEDDLIEKHEVTFERWWSDHLNTEERELFLTLSREGRLSRADISKVYSGKKINSILKVLSYTGLIKQEGDEYSVAGSIFDRWVEENIARQPEIKLEAKTLYYEQRINLLKECPSCGACYDSAAQSCAKDASELVATLPVERTINGRFRLDQLIARGGMGAVFVAMDLLLDRQVAVKIIGGAMFGEQTALQRFKMEAQAIAKLNHPNIITIYDYGVLDSRGAFLVMELARGENLRGMIEREEYIDPQKAAVLFDQLLEGVKAAHKAGIIHRDLKPENILITQGEGGRERVRILDFGLAKIKLGQIANSTNKTSQSTATGAVAGTFGYMSPEQLNGEAADERSDLFSIGVIVVEALTGRRPFSGETHHELLTSILYGSFHLEGSSKEAERLDAVLQKCLAKDRTDRFPSAAELQRELIPAIREYRSLAGHERTAPDSDTPSY